jgi:hypothetical protein
MNRAEASLETERQAVTRQFEADRNALLGDLRAKVEANTDEAQRQFGMALAWAVRGEMIRNNLDQVDQFFGEIVKLPHTERVLLADATGTVRVSTDRRHLGAALTTLVPVEAEAAGHPCHGPQQPPRHRGGELPPARRAGSRLRPAAATLGRQRYVDEPQQVPICARRSIWSCAPTQPDTGVAATMATMM